MDRTFFDELVDSDIGRKLGKLFFLHSPTTSQEREAGDESEADSNEDLGVRE